MQLQERKKIRLNAWFWAWIWYLINRTETHSFLLISAEFRGTRKEDFGCYNTPCGSNSEESEKKDQLAIIYTRQPRMQKNWSFTLKKSWKGEKSIDFRSPNPSKIEGKRRRLRNNACCLRLCRWEWVHGFKFWSMKRNKGLEQWNVGFRAMGKEESFEYLYLFFVFF